MTPLNKNIRAGAKAIKGLAKYSYRADLTKPALARYALLKRSAHILHRTSPKRFPHGHVVKGLHGSGWGDFSLRNSSHRVSDDLCLDVI